MDMSCMQDHYGRSIVELLIPTTSFKEMQRAGKYPRLQLELIPVFHSSIPFHYSIPLIPTSGVVYSFLFCGVIKNQKLVLRFLQCGYPSHSVPPPPPPMDMLVSGGSWLVRKYGRSSNYLFVKFMVCFCHK